MKRCDRKVDIGRRCFLSGAGVAAAGAAAATVVQNRAEASPQLARLSYPSNRLANIGDLKPNEPLQVAYPDADAPGVLI
jgi:arsenite oxidase small subunit